MTDDDDGEALVGPAPPGSLWWAALTARRGTQVTGYRRNYGNSVYYSNSTLGNLSRTEFSHGGDTYTFEGIHVDDRGGLWVTLGSRRGLQLPNHLALHVGDASLTLGSASRQYFESRGNGEGGPWAQTYWWFAGEHGVNLRDRDVVPAWLEDPGGSGTPAVPRALRAEALEGGAQLHWVAPPQSENSILHYEYQQEGDEDWTRTDGPETTEKVADLESGKDYRFRLRGVNRAGKGPATPPSNRVTPKATGLGAQFVSVPSMHDGTQAFTLRVAFSEPVSIRARAMRDHAFAVTGGTVTGARRVQGRSDLWELTVAPSTDGAVTVSLEAGRGCDETGAVCTSSGGQLATGAETTIPGPLGEVSVAAGTRTWSPRARKRRTRWRGPGTRPQR